MKYLIATIMTVFATTATFAAEPAKKAEAKKEAPKAEVKKEAAKK